MKISRLPTAYLNKLLNILFPPECITCNSEITEAYTMCDLCWKKLDFITEPNCVKCSLPIQSIALEQKCDINCLHIQHQYSTAKSVFVYESVTRELIQHRAIRCINSMIVYSKIKTMASSYSYDLRVKVINFLENKGTIKEASRLFNINRNTVIAWKKLKKATGDVRAKTGYQVGHRLIIKDTERFKRLVEEHNDKSSVELAKLWHDPVSPTSVLRLLKKLGYSYKKNFCAYQKGRWRKE